MVVSRAINFPNAPLNPNIPSPGYKSILRNCALFRTSHPNFVVHTSIFLLINSAKATSLCSISPTKKCDSCHFFSTENISASQMQDRPLYGNGHPDLWGIFSLFFTTFSQLSHSIGSYINFLYLLPIVISNSIHISLNNNLFKKVLLTNVEKIVLHDHILVNITINIVFQSMFLNITEHAFLSIQIL